MEAAEAVVEAPKWEPIERELLVVLLAINIFLRTAENKIEHIHLEDLLESRLWKEHTQPI